MNDKGYSTDTRLIGVQRPLAIVEGRRSCKEGSLQLDYNPLMVGQMNLESITEHVSRSTASHEKITVNYYIP